MKSTLSMKVDGFSTQPADVLTYLKGPSGVDKKGKVRTKEN